jgi:hypothetical protein
LAGAESDVRQWMLRPAMAAELLEACDVASPEEDLVNNSFGDWAASRPTRGGLPRV